MRRKLVNQSALNPGEYDKYETPSGNQTAQDKYYTVSNHYCSDYKYYKKYAQSFHHNSTEPINNGNKSEISYRIKENPRREPKNKYKIDDYHDDSKEEETTEKENRRGFKHEEEEQNLEENSYEGEIVDGEENAEDFDNLEGQESSMKRRIFSENERLNENLEIEEWDKSTVSDKNHLLDIKSSVKRPPYDNVDHQSDKSVLFFQFWLIFFFKCLN